VSKADRMAVLLGLRTGGAALLLVSLWMFLGGSFAGRYGFGGVLFVTGLFGLFGLPWLLARRWRRPR
jgi:hypothetical protein